MRQVVSMVVFVCILVGPPVTAQINSVPGTSQRTFYLDTSRDCNDKRPRDVGQSAVQIFGISTEYQGTPVLSCTLTLSTENVREPYRFKLQYSAIQIDDPGVSLYVYDGEAGGRIKWAWSSTNAKPPNLDFDFTTGSLVTFKLTRGQQDRHYDIRIIATPIPSEVAGCDYENQYNCGEYGYSYRVLGTKEIAGIVAGCFALVILIVVVIVICCYCRTRGITRKWTEEKLGHVNTAASLHTLNGHVPKSSSSGPASKQPWTTAESTRSGFASIRRSPNLPRAKIARSSRRGNGDSLSDSNASLPAKRPLPPPQVNRNPRGTSERNYNRRYNDRFSDDDRSSDRSFGTSTKNYSEKNYKPPTYREALRYDTDESADEHTFVQADESQQSSVFIERELEPRVKKKTGNARTSPVLQPAPPPPVDDGYDSIGPKKGRKLVKGINKQTEAEESSEEETDQSDEDNETSDEESEEEEEESEEESEAEQEKDQTDAHPVYSKPDKSKGKGKTDGKNQNVPQNQPVGFRPPGNKPQQFQQVPYPTGYMPPGVQHPQPRYPGAVGAPTHQPYYPQGQQPYPGVPQQFPHGYPQPMPGQGYQGFPPQQGPAKSSAIPPSHAPAQNAPSTKRSAYDQANFSVPLQNAPNPSQEQRHHSHQKQPYSNRNHKSTMGAGPNDKLQPNQPPVYSYLVNRGYQPVDGRHSPVSTSTGASNLSGDRNLHDDSDYSANIGSGVELLKRK